MNCCLTHNTPKMVKTTLSSFWDLNIFRYSCNMDNQESILYETPSSTSSLTPVPAIASSLRSWSSSIRPTLLGFVVLFSALTGFLMGFDLSIVAVVLNPINDEFGLCRAKEFTCLKKEVFVAMIAPGALVSSYRNWKLIIIAVVNDVMYHKLLTIAIINIGLCATSFSFLSTGRQYRGRNFGRYLR